MIDCNIQRQPATADKWTECLHVSRQQIRQEIEVYTRTYRTGSDWDESPSATHTHGAEKNARMIKKNTQSIWHRRDGGRMHLWLARLTSQRLMDNHSISLLPAPVETWWRCCSRSHRHPSCSTRARTHTHALTHNHSLTHTHARCHAARPDAFFSFFFWVIVADEMCVLGTLPPSEATAACRDSWEETFYFLNTSRQWLGGWGDGGTEEDKMPVVHVRRTLADGGNTALGLTIPCS